MSLSSSDFPRQLCPALPVLRHSIQSSLGVALAQLEELVISLCRVLRHEELRILLWLLSNSWRHLLRLCQSPSSRACFLALLWSLGTELHSVLSVCLVVHSILNQIGDSIWFTP
jgi:hypothetical protein